MNLKTNWFRLLYLAPLALFISCGGGSVSISNEGRRCLGQAPQPGDVTRAVVANQFDCLKDLASQGADLNENTSTGNGAITPLMAAVVLQRKDIANYLIERGASVVPTFKSYGAKDFSFHLLGDTDALTRLLRRKSK